MDDGHSVTPKRAFLELIHTAPSLAEGVWGRREGGGVYPGLYMYAWRWHRVYWERRG